LPDRADWGKIPSMKVSVILPALNEAESIAQVLIDIPRLPGLEILVVDGGSTDGTPGIAEKSGARVISEPCRGYGQACYTGTLEARGEIVAFLDADGADDPRQLPGLVEPLFRGEAEMVLGSRLAGGIPPGAMPWHQQAGNRLAAGMIRRLYGLPLTDLSPFRAVLRRELLALNMAEMTYGWPTEMIVKAARQGWRIRELPVRYRPRSGGQSKISGTLRGTVLATYHILHTILHYARE
jgi:glycosyltransferase involved in cell wall biosynthesis